MWISILLLLQLFIPSTTGASIKVSTEEKCARTCKIKIVETIPYNVSFPGYRLPESTAHAWLDLIGRAKHDISIAAYKMSLQAEHVLASDEVEAYATEGADVFSALIAKSREIPVRLVDKEKAKRADHNKDGQVLEDIGAVDRRPLDVEAILGSGVNHIKLFLVDDAHFYIGSANFDWRSLNQKMELGVVVTDCPCLGRDVRSLFDSLWDAADGNGSGRRREASYNMSKPFRMELTENDPATTFISGNPLELLDEHRTADIEALVRTISDAEEFVYIHVMDYFPMYLYGGRPSGYWPFIDSAIRNAIIRGVRVRILGAPVHFEDVGMRFLMSLQDLDGMRNAEIGAFTDVLVKVFVVPPLNASWEVNESRRTHNKFIVTESKAFVGTSNWSGDYFASTTGASIVVSQNGTSRAFVNQLRSIFERDFSSRYAHRVSDYFEECVVQRIAPYCQPQEESVAAQLAAASSSGRMLSSFSNCILILFLLYIIVV